VLAALKNVALVPTGGVTTLNTVDYLNAGALAVAVGAWLTGNPDQVASRAAEMRDVVSSGR
jgi:2-keto-3-deoxy-6-phosphogluconate aldolase